MKLILNEVILWLKNGKKRSVFFEPDKVNVVTGGSLTGKTAILQIFDYCLFATSSKIPETDINENVDWYGIRFLINDKHYTVARTALVKGKATAGYFFSPIGTVPESPNITDEEVTLKSLVEAEFGINRDVKIPFGGASLSLGSKISLRYFLLFNTISQDIITNIDVFFDKQNQNRYREALPRIFDLAVGVDSVEAVVAREEKTRIEGEMRRLQRQDERLDGGAKEFENDLKALVAKAKEYGLVAPDESIRESVPALRKAVAKLDVESLSEKPSSRAAELQSEIGLQKRIIRNLSRMIGEYEKYRKMVTAVADSLRPINYLHSNSDRLVQGSVFWELFESLELDLAEVKKDIAKRVPINLNVIDLIHEHETKVLKLLDELNALPKTAKHFRSEKDKFLFLGELNARLDLYSPDSESKVVLNTNKLAELEGKLESVQVDDNLERREMFAKMLEEVAKEYLDLTKEAMGKYREYAPVFNYKEKKLELRKKQTDFVENIGSSSNHMFMHLIFSLALHECVRIKNSRFVPSLLFVDQPSRPYWTDEKNKKKENLTQGDEAKIRIAFELLNEFVSRMVKNDRECQLIVFEHVPETTWDNLERVQLVESFTDGNALVRLDTGNDT